MVTIIKYVVIVLALIIGYITDYLPHVLALIFGFFMFKHYIHRNFLMTVGLTILLAWTAYQAILGDGAVGEQIIVTLVALTVLWGAWKVFFGRR